MTALAAEGRGFCVLHLDPVRDPLDPERVLVPDESLWRRAEEFAARRAVTWWDRHPVFATREEADEYASLAPLRTEVLPVAYRPEPGREEEGWFDSFRSPHWFRVTDQSEA